MFFFERGAVRLIAGRRRLTQLMCGIPLALIGIDPPLLIETDPLI